MAKMKFVGIVDNEEHWISVDNHDDDSGIYTVELDGSKYQIDAKTMPSQIISAIIGNKSFDIDLDDSNQELDPLDGRVSVRVRGRVVQLEMLEHRRKKMKDAAFAHFAHAGIASIKAPMPGKILRYLVKDGDQVTAGQGLVVIEAMKMENELQSPKDGVVISIFSQEGLAVEANALLLTIG